jgi:hypothetical protein
MRLIKSMVPVRLVDAMPPKQAEIDWLAMQWYTAQLSDHGYKLDENGKVVDDQLSSGKNSGLTVDEATRGPGALKTDLASLRQRIEAFYGLDPLEFTVIVGKLGGSDSGSQLAGGGSPTSVYNRIGYAYGEWIWGTIGFHDRSD